MGPKQNLDHRSFFSLSWNGNEFIQIISFLERSSFKLRCETVIGIVLCYSREARYLLYIWAKLTMAFAFASLPLNFTLLFLDVVVLLDLNKNFGRSMDLMKKKAWIN